MPSSRVTIPAVTLAQPWAELVMRGWKTLLLWPTNRFREHVGSRMAIHAGTRHDDDAVIELKAVAKQWPGMPRCQRAFEFVRDHRLDDYAFSAVLGTVKVTEGIWVDSALGHLALAQFEHDAFAMFLVEPEGLEELDRCSGAPGVWFWSDPATRELRTDFRGADDD